jgi:hypothetical protein
LHDALAAERLGIPAAAVMTDRFVRSAEAVAQINGLPDYPFSVIEHPVANNSDDVLREKARLAVTQIVRLLLDRSDAADKP